MVSRVLLLLTVSLAVLVVIGLQGIEGLTGRQVFAALFYGQDDSYAQAILLYQRIPRMLVALYAGAMLAVSGLALQVLVRNPLASPGSLGVSAAATCLGVVAGVLFDASPFVQGMAALAGAGAGILCLLMVALYAGRGMKSGAVLILSGAFVSMLFTGITRAVLLQYPDRRLEFMNWSMGSVNPAYVDRLAAFWWIGVLSVLLLLMLGRPLAAMMMGDEKAASVGVDTRVVRLAGMIAALACGGSAVVVSRSPWVCWTRRSAHGAPCGGKSSCRRLCPGCRDGSGPVCVRRLGGADRFPSLYGQYGCRSRHGGRGCIHDHGPAFLHESRRGPGA